MNAPSLTPQLTIPQWLDLPHEIRVRLKTAFDIPRTGHTEVFNNKLMSDGHSHKDLAVITVPKMQEFLKETSTSDFFVLLNLTLLKVYDDFREEKESADEVVRQEKAKLSRQKLTAINELTKELEGFAQAAETAQEEVEKPKRGRPRKNDEVLSV